MSNNSTFDLQKYLIENKLTTNSKLLSEIKIQPERGIGRREFVIEIKWGSHWAIDSVEEHLLDIDFETYCYERGEQILEDLKAGLVDGGGGWQDYVEEQAIGKPFFNADMTACDIASSEDEGYTCILSNTLEKDVRDKLLDEETPDNEINDIMDSLGIEYFNNDEQ